MNANKSKKYDMIVYGMMIIAVIFVILQAFFEIFTGIGYRVALGVWIMAAVGISDFIGPMFGGELDSFSQMQLKRYVLASVLDAVAYMCLYLFIVFVANVKDPLHYIFLAVSALLFIARYLVNRTIGEPEAVKEPASAGERITPGMTIEEALIAAVSEDDVEVEEPQMGLFKTRSK